MLAHGLRPLVQTRTNGLLWMIETIWAPWLDQGGHALQGVTGQRAARATAGHGDREGPGALVVGASPRDR